MKNAFGFFIVLALVLVGGCTSSVRFGTFTVASTNNVQNLKYSVTPLEVTGESCINIVFGFPFGDYEDRIQRAMDAAIKSGRAKGNAGDLLINARVEHEVSSFLFYWSDCVKVKGDLVKL